MDASARDELRGLLGDHSRSRDLLIEHLHRIQDRYGCLHLRHLAALAAEMRLSQAEVYEVATFYAHFDVVREEDAPPPAVSVRVCTGISCALAGGGTLHRALAEAATASADASVSPSRFRVLAAPCTGACDRAPAAVVGRRLIGQAEPQAVMDSVAARRTEPDVPESIDFQRYCAGGGYAHVRRMLAGDLHPHDVLDVVDGSGLRGLGGAGFPSGQKWRFLLQAGKPRVLAVNADEGEPGTFKDRWCLETDPHRVIEGMLIAARTIEADAIYVYVRDEYTGVRAMLPVEIDTVKAAGLARGLDIHIRRGAGAYICGEETAMLESIEGKRGLPRNRPPYPAAHGLFGRPTLIHNVESLYWLRDIVEHGGNWYQREGRPRLYSVSGRVREPGIKRAPARITARQLIEEHSCGMLPGHRLKGFLPGGASGGILPERLADTPLDFGALDAHGCFVGSAAVVVLSDRDDIRTVVRNLLTFFEDESCGQCTPCRVGCQKLLQLIAQPSWDAALIGELSAAMRDASICGLGQAAPNPVLSALRFFAEQTR